MTNLRDKSSKDSFGEFNVLHISNDYSGSTVYKNLVRFLDDLNFKQIIYNPIRDKNRINNNAIDFHTPGSSIIYSHVINSTTDRIFYPIKINKIVRDIENKVDVSNIDLIHAHTWYSDGGAAYCLSKKYNIPYIVAVRNTDLNLFQKRLLYLRPFGRRILERSRNIILIAASYRKRILSEHSLRSLKPDLEQKILVLPNGVHDFCIDAAEPKRERGIDGTFHVLFIGNFTRNKNLVALQEAIKLLESEDGIPVQLHIVGEGGLDTDRVLKNVKEYPSLFKYYGRIYNKDKLKNIFGICHILAMPSKHETFGLVYVEAMLQGLPILYKKGEGIDGFYDHMIGEGILTNDAIEIKQKLLQLYKNYSKYVIDISLVAKNHNWRNIVAQYSRLYHRG